MQYETGYFEEARLDVKEGKTWYRSQKKGLEKQFAEDIKTAIFRLREMPFTHAARYKNVRIAHLDKSPFSIHFYIDEADQKIVVIAILHNRRNPAIAYKRIE
ncbi:MAG: plasmid stabilization system [Chitinophagaceae bacterium]|nr:MAG: plasmid stabilization system [Chitinophagaceae bacterium]